MSKDPAPPIPRRLGNWWLGNILGSGFSGSIFRADNVHTGQVVALKVQELDHECPTNQYERYVYPLLQGGKGMPTLWAAGEDKLWDYLAIDLLGPSLDSLYRQGGKEVMDLRSVCCIAMQVIERLEFMHGRGVLHRDIQLGNCVIGLPPNEKTIYMIDFGFSKQYIDKTTHRHIPDSKAKRDFIGNYWFSSVGVHCRGKVPSRRDDLEAVALMLIHLLTPRGLPWTRNGVPTTSKAHTRLKREKKTARIEDLCYGLPAEFEEFLRYCRRLKFMDCPDYDYWIEEFRQLAVNEGFPAGSNFIWPPPNPRSKSTARRTPAADVDLEQICRDLVQMNVGEVPILGDVKNVENAARKAKKLAKGGAWSGNAGSPSEAIEISSDEDLQPIWTPKAQQLKRLTRKLFKATDNSGLANIVFDFVDLLTTSSSRNLTREGFAFLDALHRQLADPSVFIMPMRTSRPRSSNEEQELQGRKDVKLGVVARLKRQVGRAPGNKALAAMVLEFGSVTNKSAKRTVTKDGLAFLEGLGKRLSELD